MIDKGINIKKIDLSGVSFPTDDASTCALVYTAVKNTYGFPLYLTNFKINDEKRDSVLVSPIILTDSVVINLGDYYLTISATAITATAGVNLIGATIDSDGDVEVGKNLEVDGTSTLTGDVSMGGDATITDDVSIGGDATITGDLNVTGDIKGMEKIVDSDGNKRFVEGSGTLNTIAGVTITYNKWSLSGTHLMIVLAGKMNGVTLTNVGTMLASYNLPAYIKNKIVPVYSYVDSIDIKTMSVRKSNGTATGVTILLRIVDNKPRIDIWQAITLDSEDYDFRIQFDLLIDAE